MKPQRLVFISIFLLLVSQNFLSSAEMHTDTTIQPMKISSSNQITSLPEINQLNTSGKTIINESISLRGQADMDEFVANYSIPGTGEANDPYIISSFIFNLSNIGIIEIRDLDKHLIFENNIFYKQVFNFSDYAEHSSNYLYIALEKITQIAFDDNEFYGITVLSGELSIFEFKNNYYTNSYNGIDVRSNYTVIQFNTFTNIFSSALSISDNLSGEILGNTFDHNGGALKLLNSINFQIFGNDFLNDFPGGVYGFTELRGLVNVSIYNNFFNETDRAIDLWSATNFEFYDNTILNFKDTAIRTFNFDANSYALEEVYFYNNYVDASHYTTKFYFEMFRNDSVFLHKDGIGNYWENALHIDGNKDGISEEPYKFKNQSTNPKDLLSDYYSMMHSYFFEDTTNPEFLTEIPTQIEIEYDEEFRLDFKVKDINPSKYYLTHENQTVLQSNSYFANTLVEFRFDSDAFSVGTHKLNLKVEDNSGNQVNVTISLTRNSNIPFLTIDDAFADSINIYTILPSLLVVHLLLHKKKQHY